MTGKPIYGVEERPVPQSEVPLERTSKTQPFPLKPPPLARMTMSAADIATVTPELEAACRKLIEGVQLGGPYLPRRLQPPARAVPRQSRRRQLGRHVVQSATGLSVRQHERAGAAVGPEGSRSRRAGRRRRNGVGNRVDPDGPYEGVPGGGRFSIRGSDSQQLPCQQPPWGQLTAVNVNTGEFAWRVPLGVTDSLPPDKQKTGRPGNGGTIATAGGLVFVGATDDGRFRAFDAKTGKELWTFKLRRRGGSDADDLSGPRRQAVRRHHVHRRRLLQQPGDRRQHHGVRARRAPPVGAGSMRRPTARGFRRKQQTF